MLNVLLESKAVRTKRMGGTLMSVLVHGAIATGVIAVGVRPKPVNARMPDVPKPTVIYVPVEPRPEAPRDPGTRSLVERPSTPTPAPTPLPIVDHIPPGIPPADLTAAPIRDVTEFTRGVTTPTTGTDRHGLGGPVDGVLEERYVDRAPRILGTPITPVFPTSLRERGVNGRVSVQFVIDTLGRAEMSGLRVVEATDPLFAQSVRAVLGRYRFSPGEVGGQKVRTLVQLPFDFTLVR
ncbi:MAG: energy transducer TonB [Gemmatimonadaceae bacterium]